MSDYLEGKRVVDLVLISTVRGYKNATLIGERIFPTALAGKGGVCVPTFGKTAFAEYDTERAIGTDDNALVRERTGTLDLILGERDLAAPVDCHEQVGPMFNEESKAIHRATNGMNLRRGLIAACLTQDEKAYRTGYAKKLTANDRRIGGKGDPIGTIEAGVGVIRAATGLCPNLMTTGAGVMALLKFHLAIQVATGTNERKRITTEILQDPFQIEKIVIGASVSLPSMRAAMDKNNVSADIWGNNLMLHYVGKPQSEADSADENEPSFSYILRHKGMPVADKYGGAGGRVKYCRYTDIYKVAVVGGDAGCLITGISK